MRRDYDRVELTLIAQGKHHAAKARWGERHKYNASLNTQRVRNELPPGHRVVVEIHDETIIEPVPKEV